MSIKWTNERYGHLFVDGFIGEKFSLQQRQDEHGRLQGKQHLICMGLCGKWEGVVVRVDYH